MNLKTLFVIIGIVCYITTYAADYLLENNVAKGIILIFSSTLSCFSFLKAMIYKNKKR